MKPVKLYIVFIKQKKNKNKQTKEVYKNIMK